MLLQMYSYGLFTRMDFISHLLHFNRQELRVPDNHGMIYIAKLKDLLHMMFSQTLNNVGEKLQNGQSLEGVLKRLLIGMMMLY